jgi:DNA-binding transcriptional regulator YhcF (GntR family)
MEIKIDKKSPVPLKIQISMQIQYGIANGTLPSGERMPGVRALARRLRISEGTVGAAYKELVDRRWLAHRHARGSFLVVRPPDRPGVTDSPQIDLDTIIDEAMHRATESGHTLRDLRRRVRERLQMAPPDHVVVIEEEAELRRVFKRELSEMLAVPVEAMAPEVISDNPEKMTGALAVFTSNRALQGVFLRAIPKGHPYLAITPSSTEDAVRTIRELEGPSVIMVVSISRRFLDTAIPFLAPHTGSHHELTRRLVRENERLRLPGADLVFCDTIAYRSVVAPRVIPYRIVSSQTAGEISARLHASLD